MHHSDRLTGRVVKALATWQRPACSLYRLAAASCFFMSHLQPWTLHPPLYTPRMTTPRAAGRHSGRKSFPEARYVVCAGQSELTAIVGGVLAAALLIAAVIVALVCCKKSKRDKYTSKR